MNLLPYIEHVCCFEKCDPKCERIGTIEHVKSFNTREYWKYIGMDNLITCDKTIKVDMDNSLYCLESIIAINLRDVINFIVSVLERHVTIDEMLYDNKTIYVKFNCSLSKL